MSHRRISKRRVIIAGAGVAALAAGTLTVTTANASPDTPALKSLSQSSASQLASKLTSDLKGDAGAYYDAKAKKLVVNVTDSDAKKKVEAAGAQARVVKHSLAQLDSVKDTLTKKNVTGTARAVDVKTNKVVITADKTVKGEKLAQLKRQIKEQGGKAELKRTNGKFTTKIAGGDAIWGDGGRCSLGFNVTVGGKAGFLTAGHCTTAISAWSDSQGGEPIAESGDGKFPGNDYGIAMYTGDTDHPSEVNLYDGGTQAISGAADAEVGQKVTRSGSTTQVHDGSVKAVDASVTYPEGTVDGLIQTDVCAEPGDSGGSLFAGDKAVGLTSGGSGDCSSGGETYFQPVPAALDALGAEIG
ncbi:MULTISPECIES: S1 family peptidase [unclassified Streptomyces]|uniref:S1 family peptidase n=1 Tax=unclassified Streptomyces TaxID=2593676 RepID=UPI002DDAEEB8|nr:MULTISPECIES: S1 family peptidase [unclassified Streptomyces]WSA95760.1 S1 family peptidase [Streptomyces sp. NBC_01795]WSB80180.1 S1 family peptidase [Streptomyces sp. NBC_01775]WSS11612.1 S1 family peptidase [Streptomyces sp. NBC_01186]WSS40327.1 S1 family peptidase [Streptomyces sp. NBC_01187]